MAVPRENLLSLGHLIGRGQDTLSKQRELDGKNSATSQWDLPSKTSLPDSHQHLRVMHLQQRLKELKERERIARQRNKKLLQQFDEAQDALKEMLASNAAMKMIRTEYERYLQENGPHWQQQLKEKTRSAHEKRIKEHLESDLKNNEVPKSGDQPCPLQGSSTRFLNTAAPQEHFDLSQDGWLSHRQPQPAGSSLRSPYQSFSSSQVPPSLVPSSVFAHFHPSPHHNLTSTPSHHKPWSMRDADTWTSLQTEQPLSQFTGVAGIAAATECLMDHLKMGEPPPERRVSIVREEEETSTASSSKRQTGGGSGSNLFSQELDIKPVRLSSGHAESSESGRDSSPAPSKKKRRGGKTRRSSDGRSSQPASAASSSPVIAPVTPGQGSDSDAPSLKRHSSSSGSTETRHPGLAPGPGKPEKVELQGTVAVKENSESSSEESRQDDVDEGGAREESANEKVGNKYPDDKSQGREEELGSQDEEEEDSDSLKIKNGAGDEIEKQENSSTEESSSKEEEENFTNNQRDGKVNEAQEKIHEEKQDMKFNTEGEEDDDDDDVSIKISDTEEEEETGAEDEDDAQGDDEDPKQRETDPVSCRDEERHEGSEEEGKGSEEEDEERRSDGGELEEDRDSEDSIISPQEKRPKQIHVIPEDDEEEEEESEEESSDGDSDGFSDDDIENLLAPQEQKNEEEHIQKSDEKSTEICDKVQIFQVKQKMKSDQSDSDEFDHFYD